MTLQMEYQERIEFGKKIGREEDAIRMLKKGNLSIEEIAEYTDLPVEKVLELKRNF